MTLKSVISLLATLLILLVAVFIGRTLWVNYMDTPWTRDGRVRADVINVAADVSGIVVDVPVRDNQLVKKGDLLMQIDPDHYRIAVKQAESLVASRKATLEMRQLNARRARGKWMRWWSPAKAATTPTTPPPRRWPTTSRPRPSSTPRA
ncbi:fusaric acid resistance protein [Pseudomonas aeruginosa]|nr:fusaric acid resistance protein [Pseudomonas aeruginosa]